MTTYAAAEGALRLRIYCEALPYEVVTRPRTTALLRRYALEIVLAVRPWQLRELPSVARALAEAGVVLSVWPMLADAQGRWASTSNAAPFAAFVRTTVEALAAEGLAPREVLFDLEPPFAHAQALAVAGSGAGAGGGGARLRRFGAALPRAATAEAMDAASRELSSAVADLHSRGVASAAAVWPLVALDSPGGRAWQALLGTPVEGVGAERVSVMVYTSILEGWSRGALRRRDVTALLAAASDRAARRWGEASGVSLGCVGTGALVDEPVYRDPGELGEDASIVRASGCRDLSLFDLGGVLSREPAEAWLEAFAHGAQAARPRSSKRVAAARRLARLATWALARRTT